MALLDSLQFSPQLYGGQGGNLLDLIRSIQQTNDAYKPSAGFSLSGPQAVQPQDDPAALPANSQPTAEQETIAVGDYQMPRIGFGVPGVPSTTNAPPAAMSAPPPSSKSSFLTSSLPSLPSIGDVGNHLLAGAQSFANSTAVLPALVNGFTGLLTGQRTDPAGQRLQGQNMTARVLLSKGVSPDAVNAALTNPELMKALITQQFGKPDTTDKIKNYKFGLDHPDFAATLGKDSDAKMSLSPIYGTDANGNPVALQLSNKGGAQTVQLPSGVTLSKNPIKIDTGTEIQFMDPITRQIVARQPKNLAAAAAETAKGKIQGQVQAALPGDISNAEQTVDQITKLIDNKGLPEIVGPLDQYRPSWTMSGSGRDALARYNQLKGKAFLQAYSTLRGGGQITEVEGQKAQDAIARMDRAQNEEDFKQALTDFRDAVKTGVQKLKEKAGVSGLTQGKTASGLAWSVE